MRGEVFEEEHFDHLNISGEVFEGCEFTDCSFDGCVFENCELKNTVFTECVFTGCTVTGLKTDRSGVKFLKLKDCALSGVNWSLLLPAGRFGEPVSALEGCRLKYNTFTDMNFRKFHFAGNAFAGSLFGDCNLAEADFSGCELKETEFFRCDLRKTDFRGASGYVVDILSCKVKGARFSYDEAIHLLDGLDIRIE